MTYSTLSFWYFSVKQGIGFYNYMEPVSWRILNFKAHASALKLCNQKSDLLKSFTGHQKLAVQFVTYRVDRPHWNKKLSASSRTLEPDNSQLFPGIGFSSIRLSSKEQSAVRIRFRTLPQNISQVSVYWGKIHRIIFRSCIQFAVKWK